MPRLIYCHAVIGPLQVVNNVAGAKTAGPGGPGPRKATGSLFQPAQTGCAGVKPGDLGDFYRSFLREEMLFLGQQLQLGGPQLQLPQPKYLLYKTPYHFFMH